MPHYNAFISYNHNPRDMKIAANLQKWLENYRIPANIKSAKGLDKIERVFLDKGELEVAGDLSKVICEALENSDNLIVICSPESHESIWVKREIEYYLQNHDIESILTVITDGEPSEVLPDILLMDESGQKMREPLSCDFRGSFYKDRTVELPRLIAAMLGCKYDDLMQRQRHYRMRRLTITGSVIGLCLIAAIAYLLWSNYQIRQALDMTLREESINLAMQSEQALSRGDRISAIKYALDGLPSEKNVRPIVARSVKALADATYMYKTPRSENWNADRQYEPKGASHARTDTLEYKDHVYFAELFTNGKLSIWEAESGKELFADYLTGLNTSIQNFAFTDDGKAIMVTSDKIYVVDLSKEKELRSISLPQGSTYSLLYSYRSFSSYYDDLAVAGGSLWLPVISPSDDGTEYHAEAFRIDLDKGKIAEKHRIDRRPKYIDVSSDGKYIALLMTDLFELNPDDHDLPPDHLQLIRTSDFSTVTSIERPYISDSLFDGSGRLILCGFETMPKNFDFAQYDSVDITGSGSRSLTSYATSRTVHVSCHDPSSGSELWSDTYDIRATGTPWLEVRKTGDNKEELLCTTGNTAIVTDSAGNEETRLTTTSIISSYFNTEDMIRAVLFSGELMTYDAGKDSMVTLYNIIDGPVTDSSRCGKYIFTVTSGNSQSVSEEITTQHVVSGKDPEWQDYEYGADTEPEVPEENLSFVTAEACSGGRFVEIWNELKRSDDGKETTQIIVRDALSGNVLLNHTAVTGTVTEKPQYVSTCFKYSGIDADAGKAYFVDNQYDRFNFITVDLQSGKEKESSVIFKETDGYYRIVSPFTLTAGFAGIFSQHDRHICYLTKFVSYPSGGTQAADKLVVMDVDPESGDYEPYVIKELGTDSTEAENVRINAACRRVVCIENDSKGNHLVCYDFDGNKLWTQDAPDYISGFAVFDDGTAALLEEGRSCLLHFHSSKDGSESAVTDLGSLNLYDSEELAFTEMSDTEIMVTAGNDAYLLSRDTYELRTLIGDTFLAYDKGTKQFMLGNAGRKQTGHVPYRSLDEMIRAAAVSIQ